MFIASPFDGLQEHAQKVKECAWVFQQAMECHVSNRCEAFEELRQKINKLETEADAIKRRIRYLRQQDNVLDKVEETLNWLSYRSEPGVPKELEKDFLLLVDKVIDPIDELSQMVAEARKYFKYYSEKQRVVVKNIIRTVRNQEHEADELEEAIKQKAFNLKIDPVTAFHMIRLAEIIGSIADHAENAGDMMRAMIAR
jgi:predicted phosphate transport protein (TIGR00153 family)